MSKKRKRNVSKGTGKRYKSTKPRPTTETARRVRPPEPTYAEKKLRQRIPEFAYKSGRFKDDAERALELYFQQKPGPDAPLTLDETELPGFQEWYFFDYVTQTGERIINLFVEEIGPQLSDEQRAMLDDWLVWNRARLLEFQEIKPGIGVVVQDLLSEEFFEVNDISASYSATRWMFGLFRPILTAGRVSFTGSAIMLPPTEKSFVLSEAQELWEQYQTKNPDASLSDFYRDHSLDLHLLMKRATDRASQPPIPLSAEGHPLVLSRARYRLRGAAGQVEAALDASEEFVYAGPSDEHQGALHYNWLQLGRSHVPQATEKPEGRGVLMKTEWTKGPGKPSYTNLGDLSLSEKWLELKCMSRERLQAGKALLETILGKQITHLRDRFEDLTKNWDTVQPGPPMPARPERRPDHVQEEMEFMKEDVRRRMTLEWLDQLAIDGILTPRQAVKTPEGRKKVVEVLKQLEYITDKRARHGEPPTMDIDLIRSELGLEG